MIFKVVYRPTIVKQLTRLSATEEHCGAAIAAQLFAIYYAAVVTLTPQECLDFFYVRKGDLLDRYRLATENFLTRADFLNTNELITLQAFVIYLVCDSTLLHPAVSHWLTGVF